MRKQEVACIKKQIGNMKMKRSTGNIIFVTVCMAVGLIPFVGMSVAKTETTTENRVLSEWPSLSKDGSFNVNFLPEAGS